LSNADISAFLPPQSPQPYQSHQSRLSHHSRQLLFRNGYIRATFSQAGGDRTVIISAKWIFDNLKRTSRFELHR